MSTHNAQSVASKYQVSVNKPRLFKKMAESRSELGQYKKVQINLECCVKAESKGAIKNI